MTHRRLGLLVFLCVVALVPITTTNVSAFDAAEGAPAAGTCSLAQEVIASPQDADVAASSTDRAVTTRAADGSQQLIVGAFGSLQTYRQAGPNSVAWQPQAWLDGDRHQSAAAVAAADGRLDLFAVSESGAVLHSAQAAPGGDFGAWSELGGTSVEEIAVARNVDGRVEIFARTAVGAVNRRTQTAEGGWEPWGSAGIADAASIAAARNKSGVLEVFAVKTDGTVHHSFQFGAGNWWTNFAPVNDGGAGAESVTAALDPVGRMVVVALQRDGSVATSSAVFPGLPWFMAPWESLGNSAVTSVAAERDDEGNVAVFVAKSDGGIEMIEQAGKRNWWWFAWSGWTSLGNPGVGVAETIGVGRNASGALQPFVVEPEMKVVHTAHECVEGGFSAWVELERSLPASDVPLPEGNLAFNSSRTGTHEVHTMAADGGGLTQLTDNALTDAFWARISPDRRTIYFYRTPAGVADSDYGQTSLWSAAADGSHEQLLRPAGTDGWLVQGHVEVAPTGDALVMSGGDTPGVTNIYTTDLLGRQPVPVTNRPGINIDPSWTPDGSKILFAACGLENLDGNNTCAPQHYDLFYVNRDGSGLVRLTDDELRDHDPYMSKDGTHWFSLTKYESEQEHLGWDIRITNGVDTWRLMGPNNVVSLGTFSPDGTHIYFSMWVADRGFQLHRATINGDNVVELTAGLPGESLYPTFG